MDQNLITQGDLPRFIMDSYEECRGPPRLFLLDKFDVAGAGACLKRYTDPSFFKVEASSSGMRNAEVQREKKIRKAKKKGSRWRNGETPEISSKSHAKLHQLFLEECVGNGIGDPARRVKLKRRLNGFPFDSKSGKSYMEKFLRTPSPDHKEVHEISVSSSPLKLSPCSTGDSGPEVLEIIAVGYNEGSVQRKSSPSSSNIRGTVLNPFMHQLSEDATDGVILTVPEPSPHFEADNISPTLHKLVDEKEIVVDEESKVDDSLDSDQSDDVGSEIDSYMDALATMESEMETDSEFRAKNDLGFLNSGKQGTDSDANEHLQAHFSDSQSTGNSTASDDWNSSSRKGISSLSYSDTPSTLAENSPSDEDVSAKLLSSTKILEPQIIGMPSDQLFVNEEIPVIQPPELVASGGASVEVGEIPSDRADAGEPSSGSHTTDLAPKLLTVGPGALLMEGTLVVSELGETVSNYEELNTRFSGKIGTNLSDSLSRTPDLVDVRSETRDDFPPTVSAENHPMDELDEEDPNVFPDASIHSLSILEGTVQKQSSESLSDDVSQTKHAESNCAKNLVNSPTSSPHSVMSQVEEELFVQTLPEVETYNPDVKHGIISEVDVVPLDREVAVVSEADAILSDGEVALNCNPVVDSPCTSNVVVKQVSEILDDVPPLNLDSAELGVSGSGESTLDEALSTEDGEELGESTLKMDLIGSIAGTREFLSDISNSTNPVSLTEVHLHLDEKETETAQFEHVLVAAALASADNDVSDEDADSPSINLKMLQEKSLSCPGDGDWCALETVEACLSENYEESKKQEEVNQQAFASPDLDTILCSTASSDHLESELLSRVPDYFLAAEAENSLHLDDAPIIPSSSRHSGSDSESVSPQLDDFIENMEDASTSILKQQAVASSVPDSILSNTLPCDQSNSEFLNIVSDSSLAAEAKNCLHLDDSATVPSSSELGGHDSKPKSLQHSSLTEELRTPPEQNVNSQADQPDVELLSVTKSSSESFSQPRQIELPNEMDHESHFGACSKSRPMDLPSHSSGVDPLPESASHKLDVLDQATDPSISFFPGLVPLPELSQINLEEIPPLPPLPPVQWRIGKLLHTSPASVRDAAQYNVDSLPSILPSAAEEKAQLGYPTQGQVIQPSGSSLPPSAVEDKNSQHVYEHLAGNVVQSDQLSLQIPTILNHRNSEDNFITSCKTQSLDPLLTLPARYGEMPQHSSHAVESGMTRPSVDSILTLTNAGDAASTYEPVSSHQKPFQQQQLVAPEMSFEVEKLEQSSGILEGKVVNPYNRLVSQPSEEYGQTHHVFLTSEEEIAWSAVESEKPNGNGSSKLPRPRNPLIDAVAAHDKSKMRKVTERVQPQMQKENERDSLLEQIRTKSFNLKPAAVTRPSIAGPKTNLKVAAILEKANAIRQALAGSDEDEDADNWSDS
ncbi:unnamed protein product [Ilex paraguariensis]|uniref:Protein SCAR n=1 Tax=Ilex paraguariensis TaxID=185542 RepID=A0ABC8SF11_9AQUA